MLFTIDVGNTNILFAVCYGERILHNFRLSTERLYTHDEIGLLISQFFSLYGIQTADIEDVCIASVVPQVMYTLTHAIRKYVGKNPIVIGKDVKTGLVNLCEEPLGIDRAVTLIGAREKYGAPLIVVDFGTATKADALNEKGEYMGGLIAPGIRISIDALFVKAAKLPRIEIIKPDRVIGRNTVGQMQSGILFGYVGSVEYIVAAMKKEMGRDDIPVITTGGLATMISGYTDALDYVDGDITIDGIRLVYDRYMKSRC